MSFEIQKARVRPSEAGGFSRSAAQVPERSRSRTAERQGRLRKASPNVAGLSPGDPGWKQRGNWLFPFLPIDEIQCRASATTQRASGCLAFALLINDKVKSTPTKGRAYLPQNSNHRP